MLYGLFFFKAIDAPLFAPTNMSIFLSNFSPWENATRRVSSFLKRRNERKLLIVTVQSFQFSLEIERAYSVQFSGFDYGTLIVPRSVSLLTPLRGLPYTEPYSFDDGAPVVLRKSLRAYCIYGRFLSLPFYFLFSLYISPCKLLQLY